MRTQFLLEAQCKKCKSDAAKKRYWSDPEKGRRRNSESYLRNHPKKPPQPKWHELEDPGMRQCTKCKQWWPETGEYFVPDKRRPLGLGSWCRECNKKQSSEYDAGHKKEKSERGKQYYRENSEDINRKQQEDRQENPEKHRAWGKKSYRKRMKEKPEEVRRERRRHEANRWDSNATVRISKSMSVAMNRSLKDGKGGRHWEDLVNYTQEELMKHLESLFEPGMTWDNHGDDSDNWLTPHKPHRWGS